MLKYRNKGCVRRDEKHGLLTFDSMLEAAVFDVLRLEETLGEIELTSFQKTIYLTDARIQYRPDFEYKDLKNGLLTYVEAKGFETPSWRIKRKLWISYGPGKLIIYKGSHLRPKVHEILR